ncbi:hypothetical protein, partial [Pseudomonas putida]|uniref:hypothetical protein n=1 Tax=Pseudomonas putida TaxID=303 RepID=UPI0039E15161
MWNTKLQIKTVGAGVPANTGEAGAIHRGACFAGKPAPTEWTAPKKLDTNPTLGGSMGKYTEQFKLTAITAYLDGSNGFR